MTEQNEVIDPPVSEIDSNPPSDPPPPDPPSDPPADPPTDPVSWREQFGDDPAIRKAVERYVAPTDMAKALVEAQKRIRSGELLKPLPADATDDDIKAHREQIGIPLEATGYIENLPDGLVLSEEDKGLFGSLAESLHKHNPRPEVIHETIQWYNKFTEEQEAERQEQDGRDMEATTDLLREEYGADYRANLNVMQALLEANLPDETRQNLIGARLPDGTAVLNNPDILRMLTKLGRELNPVSSIMASTSSQASLDEEIKEIEGLIAKKSNDYWKDPKKQARYTELLSIREKMKARER